LTVVTTAVYKELVHFQKRIIQRIFKHITLIWF